MRCRYFTLILTVLAAFNLQAQPENPGRPPVRNFTRNVYRGGTQSWDICSDRQGRLYFANNEGMLQFDGAHWARFPLDNGTIVRSVWYDGQNRIYAGGQGALGFFSPDDQGRLRYQSLTPLMDASVRHFEDVWDIAGDKDGTVWFRTGDFLFHYDGRQVSTVKPDQPLAFLGKAGDQILVEDVQGRFYRPNGNRLEPLNRLSFPENTVTAALPWRGDTTLIATLKDGIWALIDNKIVRWQTGFDNWLKDKRIYSAAVLPGSRLAIGTSLGGLLLIDADRRPLQLVRKNEGLQNNNILSIAPDARGNLWLGEDNGIDLVGVNLPFYQILPDGELEGTGYAAALHQGMLYLGTSNGLYRHTWSNGYNPFNQQAFEPVSGSIGQVWGLQSPAGQLLLGHHEGGFAVQGAFVEKISPENGVWNYLQLDDTSMLAGTYKGFVLFTRKPGGNWQYRRRLSGFDESARILVRDDEGRCWVSHPYRGVFRVDYRPGAPELQVKSYGTAEGLPAALGNYAYRIAGNVVVAAQKGLFQYDPANDRFVPAKALNAWLPPDRHTQLLREDARGNIWFCQEGKVGVLWVEDQGVEKHVRLEMFPQLNGQLVGGFEYIYPAENGQVFFAVQRGFMHLRARPCTQGDSSVQACITMIQLPDFQDSILYGGFETRPNEGAQLPFIANTLRFSFAAPGLEFDPDAEYSVWLEGLDHDWSAWSAKTEKDYAHIPAGTYTFWVKTRDGAGRESAAAAYRFRIHPPWYSSAPARMVYLLLLGAVLYGFFLRQRRRFEAEKEAISTEFQQERAVERQKIEHNEQVIKQLQHEKLEVEVQHKNKELALATMHLVQKGEILSNLLAEIEKVLLKKQDAPALRNDLQRIVHALQLDIQHDEDWQQFAYHFDAVYGDFLKRLHERYPQLSNNDHRLCAYLRMNLSTKEIANLMNISVRGVEGSRYRLRKKLNLPNEDNLVEFLLSV